MKETTPAKLSRMAGVSRARISTLMKADPPKLTIVLGDDGKKKIDLDGHLTAKFLKGRKPKPNQPGKVEKQKRGRPPSNTEEPINPYQGEQDYQSSSNNPSGLPGDDEPETEHGKTWHEIEYKKQQIEEKRIKNEQKRGNLIEKGLVELLFGKIYQIDVDQIKTIGIELSPKLIAIVNSNNKIFAKIICELFESKDKNKQKEIESILNSGEKETKTKIVSACEDLSAGILNNVQSEIDNFFSTMTDE